VIVGVAGSAEVRDAPVAAGPIGSLGVDVGGLGTGPTWLVGGGPVDWDTVRTLNAAGATVLSRAVIEHPPPDSELPAEIRAWSSGTDSAAIAVVVLVVSMALLEVVLLAGPAFAVSARRQARSLALMAATGGTPRQSRRVVLAGGVVLGGVAAVLGVGLGIATARAALPLVQGLSGTWFGPFDVPWLHLVGVAGFGLLSAVLAAVVPAWIASRQDVVAVLAGRRADRPVSLRSPILGLLLVGAGVAGSAYGARASQNGEFAIAAAAVVAVLGMILLVPVVVVALARLSRRLPLVVRYAVRDAARHRTRTVPAVAAVAATVAGVVALGIGLSSDEAENVGTYRAMLPMGQAALTAYDAPSDWGRLEQVVRREVPDAAVTSVRGVDESLPFDRPDARAYSVEAQLPGHRQPLLSEWGSALGTSVLVGDRMPIAITGISAADRARGDEALAAGRPVVFTDHAVPDGTAVLRSGWYGSESGHHLVTLRVPAVFVQFEDQASLSAVLPPALVERLQVHSSTVSLLLSGAGISKDQEDNVTEAIAAITPNAGFYVERGYQSDSGALIVQLVLAALGAVLMLGGTLTATFLALSDARPDLATLSAVGASPRRRRGIAASYALVVGLVGAVLGAAVGFIPGIAVSYPLTKGYDPLVDAHYLDVPWLLVLGLVAGLPLLTAAVVGLTARSRLPLVSRLD
jgi:putative ABC transport system permease protein